MTSRKEPAGVYPARTRAKVSQWKVIIGILILAGILIGAGIWFGAGTVPGIESTHGFLRSSIEASSDNGKPELIKYLDDSRKISDDGVQLFQNGKINDLYNLMSGEARKQVTLDAFQQSIGVLENTYGRLLKIEYRNQAIEYFGDKTPVSELDQAQSKIWYASETTTHNNSGFFLIVTTVRIGTTYGIKSISYQDYGGNIPAWLQSANAPVKQP